MHKRIFVTMIVIVIAMAFATLTFTQESTQKEMKKDEKMEMTKAEKTMGPLKSISCDPGCGFSIQSRDEKEVLSVAKNHVKKVHHMDITEKKVKEMMKTVEGPGGK